MPASSLEARIPVPRLDPPEAEPEHFRRHREDCPQAREVLGPVLRERRQSESRVRQGSAASRFHEAAHIQVHNQGLVVAAFAVHIREALGARPEDHNPDTVEEKPLRQDCRQASVAASDCRSRLAA